MWSVENAECRILQINFVSHRTTSWSSTSTDGLYAGTNGSIMALVYSTDFSNTYYHPTPAHIMRKNPVFDGRVDDLSTYPLT